MQFTPIRGFINTPVSKSICVISTILPLLFSALQHKYMLNLQIDPFILEYSQYWRLALYQLSVVNESDYLLIVLLWFLYKNLERFYGSRKYLSHITVFAIYNSYICFGVMCIGQILLKLLALALKNEFISDIGIFNQINPGPLGIVSSLYVCYTRVIPISYKFNILISSPKKSSANSEDSDRHSQVNSVQTTNSPIPDEIHSIEEPSSRVLTLTNHFQIQLLFLLLLFNQGFKSIIPCLVGVVLGHLHHNEILPGSKWIIPDFVFTFFINPIKTIKTISNFTQRANSRYIRLPNGNGENSINNHTDEDADELTETRSSSVEAPVNDTPVRSLGSQFLDTFRS